jgi:hypothetical protein
MGLKMLNDTSQTYAFTKRRNLSPALVLVSTQADGSSINTHYARLFSQFAAKLKTWATFGASNISNAFSPSFRVFHLPVISPFLSPVLRILYRFCTFISFPTKHGV